MEFFFTVADWYAMAPGISTPEEFQAWSRGDVVAIQKNAPLAKCKHLPMMQARRLMSGCRYAVECGLELWQKHEGLQAIVFSSQHSELERNHRIIQAIVTNSDVSPTDFTMSVHNAAVGTLSIIAQTHIPTSAISAGQDSFLQALLEVQALFSRGCDRVLLVDFDGNIPERYQKYVEEENFAYAVAFVLEKGEEWRCLLEHQPVNNHQGEFIPDSLRFLHAVSGSQQAFNLSGLRHQWKGEKL